MSELPPSSRDNPLLNTNQPQRGGYLTPSASPQPAPPPPPVKPAASGGVGQGTPNTPATPTPTTPAAPSPRPPVIPKSQVSGLASIIDTLEAIIIALILALSFRAFVVEAFVIPTGSMAPTLLGAHFDIKCPKCGYSYKENAGLDVQYNPNSKDLQRLSPRGELSNSTNVPAPAWRLCPNCGYGINAAKLPGNPVSRAGTYVGGAWTRDSVVHFPWANNGDRILVLKYLYSILAPQRWDVIVFKEPQKAGDNYIKRLVGLPGETLQVVGGDLFVRPPSLPGEPEKPFTVARKPRHVQEAVWQLVYDNDYYPTDADEPRDDDDSKNYSVKFTSPWKGQGDTQKAWNTKGTVIRYDTSRIVNRESTGASGELRFTPRDWYLYNVRGYNNDLAEHYDPVAAAQLQYHQPITDVHLEAVWQPNTATPTLGMLAGPEHFMFRVQWNDQGLTLERWDAAAKLWAKIPDLGPIQTPKLSRGKAYRVTLDNADHQVRFFVDGQMILEYLFPWTIEDAQAYEQHQKEKPEQAQLALQVSGGCTISHLLVKRDVYYTDHILNHQNPMEPPKMWKMDLLTAVSKPVQLEADEFFAMGDNSTASYDSRGWKDIDSSLNDLPVGKNNHRGIIPRRFLLGRAFFVYWPAGFRPMNGAAPENLRILEVPLMPNVGEMRFIR